MTFKIDQFLDALEFGGARPNRFEVNLFFPTALSSQDKDGAERKLSLLCKAASIPAEGIGAIEQPFRGRSVPIAGDRTQFDAWTITVLNDEDFKIRRVFEDWINGMNERENNIRGNGFTSAPTSYMGSALVKQLGKDDEETPLRRYRFNRVWPANLSAMELEYGSNDTIQEFTVDLRFSSFVPDDGVE